jgi:hypothetical protein
MHINRYTYTRREGRGVPSLRHRNDQTFVTATGQDYEIVEQVSRESRRVRAGYRRICRDATFPMASYLTERDVRKCTRTRLSRGVARAGPHSPRAFPPLSNLADVTGVVFVPRRKADARTRRLTDSRAPPGLRPGITSNITFPSCFASVSGEISPSLSLSFSLSLSLFPLSFPLLSAR